MPRRRRGSSRSRESRNSQVNMRSRRIRKGQGRRSRRVPGKLDWSMASQVRRGKERGRGGGGGGRIKEGKGTNNKLRS